MRGVAGGFHKYETRAHQMARPQADGRPKTGERNKQACGKRTGMSTIDQEKNTNIVWNAPTNGSNPGLIYGNPSVRYQ